MERSNNGSLNGRGAAVIEEKALSQAEGIITDKVENAPSEAPAVDQDQELEQVQHPTSEPSPKKKNRKPLIFAIAAMGAIVAGTFGHRYWQHASTHEETDNATVAGHIHQVSSRVNGTVSEVEVDDNQLVQKGELLVKLDPRDFEAKVLQAQAALEAAKRQANAAQANIPLASETAQAKTTQAQGDVTAAVAAISSAQAAVEEARTALPTAQAAVAEAEAGIPAAQAQVSQADATLQQAQTDYNRYATLYQQGAIPSQQLDAARAAYEVARAQKRTAEEGVQQARARLAQAKQGVGRA
jgi:membrane fusion protein (multidrug efflux system)